MQVVLWMIVDGIGKNRTAVLKVLTSTTGNVKYLLVCYFGGAKGSTRHKRRSRHADRYMFWWLLSRGKGVSHNLSVVKKQGFFSGK